MRKFLTILSIVVLSGCASTYKGVGSQVWYDQRIQEIESANAKKEVTPAEYIRLKNEADAIRADYMDRDTHGSNFGFSYGIFR